jgi:hypothetical protein
VLFVVLEHSADLSVRVVNEVKDRISTHKSLALRNPHSVVVGFISTVNDDRRLSKVFRLNISDDDVDSSSVFAYTAGVTGEEGNVL